MEGLIGSLLQKKFHARAPKAKTRSKIGSFLILTSKTNQANSKWTINLLMTLSRFSLRNYLSSQSKTKISQAMLSKTLWKTDLP